MPASPARRVALDCLLQWESGTEFADALLQDQARRRQLDSPDRGLAQEILYTALRHLIFIDRVIDRFRRGKIKSSTEALLRIGLAQLLKTEIADHAAIHETVELAKPHEKKLVNAILRSAQRERESIEQESAEWDLADRESHPEFLIERWTEQYGAANAEALCAWNNRPAPVFARINRLAADKAAIERLAEEHKGRMLGPDFCDFFKIEGAPDPSALAAGLIYIQDPSTLAAIDLLDPKPGESILDACAAPGGKSGLIASRIGSEGQLTATDNVGKRLQRLRGNLDRLGAKEVEVAQVDWIAGDSGSALDGRQFDAILIDAPCSNTGVMRRRVDVRWRLQPWDFERQRATQEGLIKALLPRLKPGGRLVYSTCSIDREENEGLLESLGLEANQTRRSFPPESGFDGSFAARIQAKS
ncbi:MAG: 16S rRNA (cytosine(967)-C(5))-methyltransferase RsmB [Verrucomicrobiota bacterium]